MDFDQDYFGLFGLPRRQDVDTARLESLYRDLQARVHPDKHAHLSNGEQRLAMQWATRVNEAYLTLKDPLKRARYLLQLAGHDAKLETNTAMPMEFLMAQMELREQVAEAKESGDAEMLDGLHRKLRKELRVQQGELQAALDGDAFERGGELVRQLMFQEKLLHEVDEALAVLES